jgi:hypothetical protein
MTFVRLLWIGALGAAGVTAQWLDFKTPDIPRGADGKPNLAAPAPTTADGKPDLSGLWQVQGVGNSMDITGGQPIEMTALAKALFAQRMATYGQSEPTTKCLPAGPKAGLFGMNPLRIVQSPTMMAILYEEGPFRQIYADGRPMLKNPNPSWMGYSTAHWENDVFVIETNGYNDKSWLDYLGHPHSDLLHMTERLCRTDFGHMMLDVTFEDPKYYLKPISAHFTLTYQADTDMIEYVCAENERDDKHLIGAVSDEKKHEVQVPETTLALYDGDYEFPGFGVMKVSHNGSQLNVQLPGGDARNPAFAQSDKKFILPIFGGVLEFIPGQNGKITHMLMNTVEGEDRGEKKN